jgi:hypothetical protein
MGFDSSTKNAQRGPPLESLSPTGLLGQDDWYPNKHRPKFPSTLDSAPRNAKYCARGLALRDSKRARKMPSREPSLESPCDWPLGPRRVTCYNTAKILSPPQPQEVRPVRPNSMLGDSPHEPRSVSEKRQSGVTCGVAMRLASKALASRPAIKQP